MASAAARRMALASEAEGRLKLIQLKPACAGREHASNREKPGREQFMQFPDAVAECLADEAKALSRWPPGMWHRPRLWPTGSLCPRCQRRSFLSMAPSGTASSGGPPNLTCAKRRNVSFDAMLRELGTPGSQRKLIMKIARVITWFAMVAVLAWHRAAPIPAPAAKRHEVHKSAGPSQHLHGPCHGNNIL